MLDNSLLSAARLATVGIVACICGGSWGCAASQSREEPQAVNAATIPAVSPDETPNFEAERPPFPVSVYVEGDGQFKRYKRIVPEFKPVELTAEEKEKLGRDKQKRYDPLAFYKGRKVGENVSQDLAGPAVGIGQSDRAGASAYGRGDAKWISVGIMTPVPLIGFGEPKVVTTHSREARAAGGNLGSELGGVKPGYAPDPRRYWHERKQED